MYHLLFFFFSSRRRHTRSLCDWSSDVCSSDLALVEYMIVDKQSGERTDPWRRYRSLQGLTAAETEFCPCQVCCTAVNTVERRRNHIPAFLPQDDEKVAC